VPYLQDFQVDSEQVNQSLPGLIVRLMTPSLAIKPDDGTAPILVNALSLSPQSTQIILQSTTMLTLLALALICRAPLANRYDPRLIHEACLTLIAMLLLSERSWKHHFVTLTPTYVVLTTTIWELTRTQGRRREAWLLGSLIAFS